MIKKSLGRWEHLSPVMRARFLEEKLVAIDARIAELKEMRAHLVEKIAWTRSEKSGMPEELTAASRVRKKPLGRR